MKILDTDVCIEILRGNERVLDRRLAALDEVATTWVTACELAYGAAKSAAPQANHTLVVEFLNTLPVVGIDLASAERFGQLKASLEQGGKLLADADLLIAAITLARGASLVTGNWRHYQRIPELRLEDWIRGDI